MGGTGTGLDHGVGEIADRVDKALLAFKIEQLMLSKEEENEMGRLSGGAFALDLEQFSCEPFKTTKERYQTEFSRFCAAEIRNVNSICSQFRSKNNLNS